MRSGQPGVPTEDDWLTSPGGADLQKGKKILIKNN
jgi:hypothetical protein